MHAGGSSGGSIISNMQLAPLVDVALVLVIIFMVTAPMLNEQAGMAVDLPKAATIEARSEDNVTITLAANGEVALNDDKMPLYKLETELRKIVIKHSGRLVLIRADKEVTHKQILELMSMAKRSGAKKMAIATLQRPRPMRRAG
jgi:biopolymer transport protein ExbD